MADPLVRLENKVENNGKKLIELEKTVKNLENMPTTLSRVLDSVDITEDALGVLETVIGALDESITRLRRRLVVALWVLPVLSLLVGFILAVLVLN